MESNDNTNNTIGRTEAIFKLVLENNIELRMIKQLLIDQQTATMTPMEKQLFIEQFNLEVKRQSLEAADFLLGKLNPSKHL